MITFLCWVCSVPSYAQPAPGGVTTSLELWLKADAGTTGSPTVTSWADQTSNGYNATAGGDPQIMASGINFNPTIGLDGTDDYFGGTIDIQSNANTAFTIVKVAPYATSGTVQEGIFSIFSTGQDDDSNPEGMIMMSRFFSADWVTGWGNGNVLSNTSVPSTNVTDNTFRMISSKLDGSDHQLFVEGQGFSTASHTQVLSSEDYYIGARSDGSPAIPDGFLQGEIAEVIHYEQTLSAADQQKVESYLAIKYGLTLSTDNDGNTTALEAPNGDGIQEGDYVASDETILWDASALSVYTHDIAGIGRDDNSGLSQEQSISHSSDAMIIIDKGGAFTTDLDFLLWGNDNGTTTMTATDKHPDFDERLEREWLVAANGSPGTVTVQMLYSGNNGITSSYALLIDGDGTFALGATSVPAAGISGDTITFEDVTLTDGDYFTLAEEMQFTAGPRGPGGIGDTDGTSNLVLWLNADNVSTNSVSTWSDASGYENHATAGPDVPTLIPSSSANGQPVVSLDEDLEHYMYIDGTANPEVLPTSAMSLFMAAFYDPADSEFWGGMISSNSRDARDDGWGMFQRSSSGDMAYYVDDYANANRTCELANIEAYHQIYGMIYDTSTPGGNGYESEGSCTMTGDAGAIEYNKSGTQNNILLGVSVDNGGPQYYSTLEVGEVILYDDALTNAERIILNNYLSAKYEIALTTNDAYRQDDNGYDYDVAGIGQASDNSTHTDSQGTGILRIMNPQALGTDEFLFWGHDNGAFSALATDVPLGLDTRLERQWRVSELDEVGTGVAEVGNVDMIFDLSGLGTIAATDLRLLVDTDGDFSNATEISGAIQVDEDRYAFLDVSALDDGVYFTIATADRTQTPLIAGNGPRGPGGVGDTDGASSLSLWLDASTLSAGPVTTWEDQSGNGNDAQSDTATPGFNSTGLGNSRPAVTFNGSDQNLVVTGNSEILPTDALSVFVMGNYSTAGSENYSGFVATFDDAGRNDGWSMMQDVGTGNMLFFVDDDGTSCAQTIPTTDEIWGLMFDGAVGSGYISEDSCGYNFAGPINYDVFRNDDLLIGTTPNNSGPNYFMSGEIGEIIQYNEAVNDAQRIIISNYLAAKYDITLSTYDLYDEDNDGYDYEVAGIGQSVGGDQHTDAQGSGIIRMLSPASLSNGAFLLWGHDNGALTDTETGDIPNTIDRRLERIWALSEPIDVGAVDVVIDLSSLSIEDAGLVRLLVDTNGGGFSDATVISGATTLDNNAFLFPGLTSLDDNARFTIGMLQQGPGHVIENLEVWLKSDEGTVGGGTVTAWSDQSRNGNDADNVTGDPEYLDNVINYNPAIELDGTSEFLTTTATSIIGNDGAYTKYAVVVSHDVNSEQSIVACDASGDHDLSQNGAGQVRPRHGAVGINNMSGFVEGQAHLVGFRYDGAANVTTIDGRSTTTGGMQTFTDGGSIVIGARDVGTALFDGYMAEVIVYNAKKDDSDAAKIESYLGMKYGITLDDTYGGDFGDFVDSDGSTLWDASADATYHNDVIAIGRDDRAGLYQRQSRSTDGALKLFISSLANSNALNTGDIPSDLSFLIMGHNNGQLQSDAATETEVPAGIETRLGREWRVTNTNFAEDYTLQFEWNETGAFDISHIRLMVDVDGDFSDATYYGSPDVEIVDGSIIVSGVGTNEIPLNSTRYVTLGSVDESTTLPIELISFQAYANGQEQLVQLSWSTASEIDNDFFTIERSGDAKDWQSILQTPGAGNTDYPLDYNATDEDPLYGLSYYRLKQTDFDGTSSYSEAVFVTLGEFEEELTIYPNPTQRFLTIKGQPEQLQSVRIIDVMGKEYRNVTRPISRTATTITLDIAQLPVGIYTVLAGEHPIKLIKSP